MAFILKYPGSGDISLTCNSNLMENSFCCNSNFWYQITTKFCAWHDSTAVMSCAKVCIDHIFRIRMRAKWNFHLIFIFDGNIVSEMGSLFGIHVFNVTISGELVCMFHIIRSKQVKHCENPIVSWMANHPPSFEKESRLIKVWSTWRLHHFVHSFIH